MAGAGMAARPYPLAIEEEKEEEKEDVDVESLHPDTDEEVLPSGQPQVVSAAQDQATSLGFWWKGLLGPSASAPWQLLTLPRPSLIRLGELAIAALILPPKSILGIAGTPSRNYKMMDALLAKMHRAMAVQAQLVAILSFYQWQLARCLEENYSPQHTEELKQVAYALPRLIKEQAEAARKAMAALWLVRHHLWLSQSSL